MITHENINALPFNLSIRLSVFSGVGALPGPWQAIRSDPGSDFA